MASCYNKEPLVFLSLPKSRHRVGLPFGFPLHTHWQIRWLMCRVTAKELINAVQGSGESSRRRGTNRFGFVILKLRRELLNAKKNGFVELKHCRALPVVVGMEEGCATVKNEKFRRRRRLPGKQKNRCTDRNELIVENGGLWKKIPG